MKKEQEEARGKKERGDIWKSKKGNRSSCKRKRERKNEKDIDRNQSVESAIEKQQKKSTPSHCNWF